MNYRTILFSLCFLTVPLCANISSEWAYSRATSALQKGEYKQAQDGVSALLVDNPDRPDLLYDAGIAAYKLKEFEKADAYFQAASQKAADDQLKKQALFNGGNSNVALQNLKGALNLYEQALAIDSEDQIVTHNRDVVKKMLEEQQKQEQQQQNQDNQDQEKQDQDSNDQDSQEQNQDNDSQSKESEQNSSGNQDNRDQGNSSQGEQEKEQGADNDQSGEHDDQVGDESNRDQSNQQKDNFSDDHTSSSSHNKNSNQQKTDSQPSKEDGKEQALQEVMEDPGDYRQQERENIEKSLPQHQKWMARALEKLEEIEDKEQKKLIKAQMQKQAVEHDGQNSW